MQLEFNAPAPREQAAALRLKPQRGGTATEPALQPNAKTVEGVEFRGPFPENARYTVELPRAFEDDAGRAPENKSAFPLSVAPDAYPPLVKFPGRFGILELNTEPLLPVTVRAAEAPRIPGFTARFDDRSAVVPS